MRPYDQETAYQKIIKALFSGSEIFLNLELIIYHQIWRPLLDKCVIVGQFGKLVNLGAPSPDSSLFYSFFFSDKSDIYFAQNNEIDIALSIPII